MLVYLDGEYVPAEEARVSVNDRGFLFADGVYEVVRIYRGQTYELDPHLHRLRHGLAALRIDCRDLGAIERAVHHLMAQNAVDGAGVIYIQVTRGAAPRTHKFPPAGTPPTVYVAVRPYTPYPARLQDDGVAAITLPDTRWARCDIKSTSLLPNVLANEAAHAADVFEAILVRDGAVTEGSHSNVWGVRGGRLLTYPTSNYILAGLTRARVFQLAADLGLETAEEVIHLDQLYELDEVFLTGTTTEIMPVVQVDGRAIVDGEPGPITRKLIRAFNDGLPR
jgi:D-alanine transaminase